MNEIEKKKQPHTCKDVHARNLSIQNVASTRDVYNAAGPAIRNLPIFLRNFIGQGQVKAQENSLCLLSKGDEEKGKIIEQKSFILIKRVPVA